MIASPVFGCGCPADTSAKQKHRQRRQRLRGIHLNFQFSIWFSLQHPIEKGLPKGKPFSNC